MTAGAPTSMLRPFACIALAGLAACAGWGVDEQTGAGTPTDAGAPDATLTSQGAAPAEPAAHVAVALPPHGKTAASIQTLGNAECALHASDRGPAADDMIVYADNDGIVRLFLADANSARHTTLQMECVSSSGKSTHIIDVDATAVERAPAPITRAGKKTLPVLSGDPMSYSPEELRRRGYPPRPDPEKAPEAYANWSKLVVSAPVLVDRFDHPSRDRWTSCNNTSQQSAFALWAGALAQTTSSNMGTVSGVIQVPTLTYENAGYDANVNNPEIESTWVGTGGYGSAGMPEPLVQDGASSKIYLQGGVAIQAPYTFYEWLATTSIPATNTSLIPNVGDTVYVAAWAASSGSYGSWPTDGFAAPATYSSSGFEGSQTGVGDFNGDGLADAVMFNGTSTYVMLAQPSGSFGTATNWQLHSSSFSGNFGWGVGDFNGDGFDDVVGVNGEEAFVMLSNGTASGGFQAIVNWQTASQFPLSTGSPWSVGDVNGDGLMDLVACDAAYGGSLSVMLAQTNGSFGAVQTWASSLNFSEGPSCVLGDVNGDGTADLIAYPYLSAPPDAGGAYNVGLFLSTGSGFTASTWNNTAFYQFEGGPVAAGDFNGDGLADLFAANSSSGNYNVMLGVPPVSPYVSALAPASEWLASGPLAIAGAGDVNGDGAADIVAASMATAADVMLAQPGTRTWSGGDVAYYFFWDQTQNTALALTVPTPDSLASNSAEWIMEVDNNAVNGNSVVANFGTTAIYAAFARVWIAA